MTVVNSYALYHGADYPPENKVEEGTTYGDAINQLEGTLVTSGDDPVFPAQTEVLEGVQFGTPSQFTGNYRPADQTKVEAGYTYGENNGIGRTGSLVVVTPNYPLQTDVRLSVQYGDEGVNQFTGSAAIPLPVDVREGFAVEQTVGTIHVPPEAKVEDGYPYDGGSKSKIGRLVVEDPETDYPEVSDVRDGVRYDFGQLVGIYEPASETVVKSGEMYGAGGTEFMGTYIVDAGSPGDRGWVG